MEYDTHYLGLTRILTTQLVGFYRASSDLVGFNVPRAHEDFYYPTRGIFTSFFVLLSSF